MRTFLTSAAAVLLVANAVACGGDDTSGGGGGSTKPPTPVAGHPRLWVTEDDLPELRGRAVDANPAWQALDALGHDYEKLVDDGIASTDDCTTESILCEWVMEQLAFMSLVEPDAQRAAEDAQRAHDVLMTLVSNAESPGNPISDASFATGDRSRYGGRGFGTTVDWIYPTLSDDDKARIRDVFLAWIDADTHASTTTDNHPEPVGVFDDPKLVADPVRRRFAGNNYFTGHMRNIGLMAMALDDGDDPGGALKGSLETSTGAFLYMTDALFAKDAAGGLAPESMEYSPLTMQYTVDLLFALRTAGLADPAKLGPQVDMGSNAFWADVVPTFLHMLAPGPVPMDGYPGAHYDYVTFGDMEAYAPYAVSMGDPLLFVGGVAMDAKARGDTATYDAVRWAELNVPPSGKSSLVERFSSQYTSGAGILGFLVMDPNAAEPEDPRKAYPLDRWLPGLRMMFARTSWASDATFFTWQLPWNSIDHQHADANTFGLYRKGEWLTKARAGYGKSYYFSDTHNALCVENDEPEHGDLDAGAWAVGSQFNYDGDGDGDVIAHEVTDAFAYALGDATDRYNDTAGGSGDVTHASRSILWLKPDVILVYDRADTNKGGRFKRVFFQFAKAPMISGKQATVRTPGGQQIFFDALAPSAVALTNDPPPGDTPASGDPMSERLRVEATGGPKSARFLSVLQAADGGASRAKATRVQSSDQRFEGAAVGDTLVMFPVDLDHADGSVSFATDASHVIITGLAPGAAYGASIGGSITLTPGGSDLSADDAGVLVVR